MCKLRLTGRTRDFADVDLTVVAEALFGIERLVADQTFELSAGGVGRGRRVWVHLASVVVEV